LKINKEKTILYNNNQAGNYKETRDIILVYISNGISVLPINYFFPPKKRKEMRIAIEGCCHGELDKIYASIRHIMDTKGIKIDLLLICGDFQVTVNFTPKKK